MSTEKKYKSVEERLVECGLFHATMYQMQNCFPEVHHHHHHHTTTTTTTINTLKPADYHATTMSLHKHAHTRTHRVRAVCVRASLNYVCACRFSDLCVLCH